MTSTGRSDLVVSDLMSLPDIAPNPLVLCDIEAFLLGLLENEHLLGGPVRAGRAGPLAVLDAPGVSATGLLVRDPEHTPIAALTDIERHRGATVRGRLHRIRRRESGHRAELALDPDELSGLSHTTSTRLLVLDRPLTGADEPAVQELLSDNLDSLWVVVADSPASSIPLATVVACVESWLGGLGALPSSTRAGLHHLPNGRIVRLRTAPLGWRDPESDRLLVERLGALLGVGSTCWLQSDDASAGARQWQSLLSRLRTGTDSDIAGPESGISSRTAEVLLRWKPARAQRGVTLMFTGLSGSGKSTVARGVAEWLEAQTDRSVTLLDGDVVRQALSAGLGFDRAGRVANVRRIGYVATEVTRHGGVAICAPIAPYSDTRAEVRSMVEAVGDFMLIHVNTPLEECERRDLKGLYARARAGDLPGFTGVSDPYDEPNDAVLALDTSTIDNTTAVAAVIALLSEGGWLEGRYT